MSSVQWFLRHSDQVEHGPFELAAIIKAASLGNVAIDTEVRHERHTRGVWILATRVPTIRDAMNLQDESVRHPASTPPIFTPSNTIQGDAVNIQTVKKTVGVRSEEFRVPKDLTTAALALFDFRFRYYITPWIIRILWAIWVGTVLLLLAKTGYELFVSPVVDAQSSRTYEAKRSNDNVHSGVPSSGFLGASPPELLTELAFGIKHRILLMIVVTASSLTLLLCIRMILEAIIVVFRIAEDASEIRSTLEEYSKSSVN
jgi:hypothetical protein